MTGMVGKKVMRGGCFRPGYGFLIISLIIIAGCDKKESPQPVVEKPGRISLVEERVEQLDKTEIPDFKYELLEGKEETLYSNRGKLVLLNFWATWCAPCRHEMPDLEQLQRMLDGEDFRILAVNSGEEEQKVRSFMTKYPFAFDIVLDENREISELLNIAGLPTTFVLNRDLKPVGKIVGPIDWKNEEIVEYLRKHGHM